jgi:hypothetical protein
MVTRFNRLTRSTRDLLNMLAWCWLWVSWGLRPRFFPLALTRAQPSPVRVWIDRA